METLPLQTRHIIQQFSIANLYSCLSSNNENYYNFLYKHFIRLVATIDAQVIEEVQYLYVI